MVKLAEHNSIQPEWVAGHMGVDGNEVADQLARQGSPNQLTDISLPLAGRQRLLRK